MEYLFILGRNVELSNAEVLSYFEKENNQILKKSLKENGLLIELEKPISKDTINDLGGTLAIGEVLVSEKIEKIKEKLEQETIFSGKSNKLNYVLWNFSDSYEIIQEYLENSQYQMESEFEKCSHKYFKNGTISCVKCGKTKYD